MKTISKITSFSLDRETETRLEILADSTGRGKSAIVREAVARMANGGKSENERKFEEIKKIVYKKTK